MSRFILFAFALHIIVEGRVRGTKYISISSPAELQQAVRRGLCFIWLLETSQMHQPEEGSAYYSFLCRLVSLGILPGVRICFSICIRIRSAAGACPGSWYIRRFYDHLYLRRWFHNGTDRYRNGRRIRSSGNRGLCWRESLNSRRSEHELYGGILIYPDSRTS